MDSTDLGTRGGGTRQRIFTVPPHYIGLLGLELMSCPLLQLQLLPPVLPLIDVCLERVDFLKYFPPAFFGGGGRVDHDLG